MIRFALCLIALFSLDVLSVILKPWIQTNSLDHFVLIAKIYLCVKMGFHLFGFCKNVLFHDTSVEEVAEGLISGHPGKNTDLPIQRVIQKEEIAKVNNPPLQVPYQIKTKAEFPKRKPKEPLNKQSLVGKQGTVKKTITPFDSGIICVEANNASHELESTSLFCHTIEEGATVTIVRITKDDLLAVKEVYKLKGASHD